MVSMNIGINIECILASGFNGIGLDNCQCLLWWEEVLDLLLSLIQCGRAMEWVVGVFFFREHRAEAEWEDIHIICTITLWSHTTQWVITTE